MTENTVRFVRAGLWALGGGLLGVACGFLKNDSLWPQGQAAVVVGLCGMLAGLVIATVISIGTPRESVPRPDGTADHRMRKSFSLRTLLGLVTLAALAAAYFSRPLVVQEYWANGSRMRWRQFTKDSRGNMVRDGTEVQWRENGVKQQAGKWRNGKQDGKWLQWDENGNLVERSHYSAGVLEGQYTRWHPNGQKAEEGEHRNGWKHGSWSNWDDAGNASGGGQFVDGFGKQTVWRRDGGKEWEQEMYRDEDGTPHYRFTRYHPNGQRSIEALDRSTKRWTADGVELEP